MRKTLMIALLALSPAAFATNYGEPMPAGDARAEVRRYQLWQPWQTDRATVESAWALESRHGLHYRDCLIVAAAQHLGCRYLLSGELPEGQHYGAVQTIHPTTASVSLLGPLP